MDSLRLILASCLDNYDVGEDANAEWPNNMISRRAVIDEDGFLSRPHAAPKTPVSREEIALCKRLAGEAKAVIGDIEVGMGSESGDVFHPFYLVAARDEAVVNRIDESLVRARFGDTLFPPVTISIEPMEEAGVWWSDVTGWFDEEELDEQERLDYLQPWRALLLWFQNQDEFIQTAFVSVGDRSALWQLDQATYPPGTELAPSTLPRLALGLTRNGSLCGLFGVSVQT